MASIIADEFYNIRLIDLPALVGSPKQVEWAEQIRGTIIQDQLGAQFQRVAQANPDKVDAGLAGMNAAFAGLLAVTSAKFWIDNRCGADVRALAKKAAA